MKRYFDDRGQYDIVFDSAKITFSIKTGSLYLTTKWNFITNGKLCPSNCREVNTQKIGDFDLKEDCEITQEEINYKCEKLSNIIIYNSSFSIEFDIRSNNSNKYILDFYNNSNMFRLREKEYDKNGDYYHTDTIILTGEISENLAYDELVNKFMLIFK